MTDKTATKMEDSVGLTLRRRGPSAFPNVGAAGDNVQATSAAETTALNSPAIRASRAVR